MCVLLISQYGKTSLTTVCANEVEQQNKERNNVRSITLNGDNTRIDEIDAEEFPIDFQYLLIISIVSKLDSFTQLFEVVGSSFHLTRYSN